MAAEVCVMKLFLSALGLALILEGAPYFLAPEKMQGTLRLIVEQSPSMLRFAGLVAMLVGLSICYLALGTRLFS